MLPLTMNAAVLHNCGEPLKVESVPIPKVGPMDVLVKLGAAGICHTDLAFANGFTKLRKQPTILGHEGAGVVVDVGEGIINVKKGDRVGVSGFNSLCGNCEYCVAGRENFCPNARFNGNGNDGCFAEYVTTNANYVFKLPEAVPFEECVSIMCAGVTAYKAIKETEAKPGQWLAVLGIGGLGHLAIQFAVAMGLKVVAVDVRETSLKQAAELRADICVNAKDGDTVERIIKETGGGVHGAIVTSSAQESYVQSVKMLRRCGTALFISISMEPVPIIPMELLVMGKTIRGSLLGNRNDFAEALQFVADGKVKIHYSVDKLENINETLQKLDKGQIVGRAVIKF